MKFLKLLLPVSLLSLLFSIEPAFAQEGGQATAAVTQTVLIELQNVVGVFLSMLNLLIWPLLSMIGGLMGNDLIFGPLVEDRLLLIWGQIRNLINLGFVLVLVGIAIYNVAGVGEEGNYTIKKILPKFIIALIVINFTFFGAKVILSATNVMTTAIFALPNSVETNFTRLDSETIAAKNCKNIMTLYPKNEICSTESTFTPKAEQFFSNFSSDNIAFIMAMNLANISDISKVSELVTQSPTIMNVTINILVSTILYFIYGIAFTVLFIVLLVRIVVLWFAIALSPVLALQFVFPDATKSITGEFDIKDVFIKHAFAPVIIGFGMTIGYLMLDAFKQTTTPSLSASLQLGADFANAFSVGTGGIQELMIGLAAAAIVWKVTFTAAEGTLAKGVTDAIRGTVGGFAKRVASLPKYMQWIPVPANLDNDGTANGKISLPSVLATFDSKLREVEHKGSTPIGGFNKGNILAYAKDKSTKNNEVNNSLVLRSFHNDAELRNNLTIANLKQIVESSKLADPQKKEFIKLLSTRPEFDSVAAHYDTTFKNDPAWVKNASELERSGYKQASSITEASTNPNTSVTPPAGPPAP